MAYTLLQLVDQTCGEMGLTQPTVVIGAGANQTQQLLALVQRLGKDLVREHEWQRLQTEHTFSTTASDPSYALPSDYDRMVSDTTWNRTAVWQVPGSRNAQQWQAFQASLLSFGRYEFRVQGNQLLLYPEPTAVEDLAYEYVSNLWVIATGGTAPTKAAFTADNDTCIFPDDLMLAGLKYYFLKAKKLDFGVEEEDYRNILATRKAQDIPAETLSFSRTYVTLNPSLDEGSWDVD